MPFAHTSESSDMETTTLSATTIGDGRYTLRRCMAETALGQLWWSQDQQQEQAEGETANVLIFTVLPALAQNTVFEQALRQVLPSYQKAAPSQPHVTDNGKETDGTRWLAIQNIPGMLLAERMQELDDRGMPQAQALGILEELSDAISNQRPEGVFGFLEPGAVLFGEGGCRLLNAPVAVALRLATNGIISYTGRHLSFQSGYVSPEVALGDPPTSADDTFSLACIAYNLLQGNAPYGHQTTLEAAVRNAAPASIKKLKPETWVALQQGLSLKRSERQNTPTSLLTALHPKPRSRMLLPAAVITIASVVAYASYHVLSGLSQEEEKPQAMQLSEPALTNSPLDPAVPGANPALVDENTAPAQLDQESVDAEVARLAAEDKARAATEAAAKAEAEQLAAEDAKKRAADAQAQAAAAEAANAETRQQEISKLLKNAEDAIQQGKLLSTGSNGNSAADYLSKVLELDAENAEVKKLATTIVDNKHTEASKLLDSGDNDSAREILAQADKLITEFALTDSLQRQVKLEAQNEQGNREQQKLQEYITSARSAIRLGNLTEGDERSESAAAYINTLLDEYPDNAEGRKLLKEVVQSQQEQALSSMRKNNIGDARKLLDGSQQLIGKYMLDDMVERQLALETRYRDAEKMGIFPSAGEPAATTENKPENRPQATNHPTPPPHNQPEPAPAAETRSAEPEPVVTTQPEPGAPAMIPPDNNTPVEVTVPPDVPVSEAFPPPGSAEPVSDDLPPVQIDIPMVPPPAAPAPEPTTVQPPLPDPIAPVTVQPEPAPAALVFEIPANPGNNSGGSFTPDVPGLMEVPLDSINESLPPAQ
ncbi:MAG: hypothetical protein KJ914_15455 [Gammaproteobacteria bacterium]|nr:hypothetical protein [Gammaproteobacteria bacterium]MBU1723344.1 hypothetical protein [Gammaproteobacteria bacterium]MBU2006639.1 hypothetical protein [Gammaproteobacteria bacterium]